MRIEPRSAWGARKPKGITPIAPTPRLFLHHTVTGTAPAATIVRQVQAYHMDGRGWLDVAYSFLTDVTGRTWTGRGPLVAGGHTAGFNSTSHAVCAIGNFDTNPPPAALLEGLAQIAAHGYRMGWWTCRGYTGGHRDVAQTACPGRHLYAAIPAINRRVEEILSGSKPTPKPTPTPTPTPTKGLTMSEAAAIRKEIAELRKRQPGKAIALRATTGDQKVWILTADGTRYHLPNPGHRGVNLLAFMGILAPGGDRWVHPIAREHLDLIPIRRA